MASVFDAARYILENHGPMSTMKLQKLCYYAQAWSLVWDDEELFPEEFEAWANGPVCPVLFKATQGTYKVSAADEPLGDVTNLSEEQKQTLDKVIEYYASHDAQWLSRLTHMEDPWKKARNGIPDGMGSDATVSKESMAEYYGSL